MVGEFSYGLCIMRCEIFKYFFFEFREPFISCNDSETYSTTKTRSHFRPRSDYGIERTKQN